MSQLHKALECLRPKDFGDVPIDELASFLADIFANAELIANSVPLPPNGTPYESSHRTRTDATPATSAADLTVSQVRRPPPAKEQADLQKAWGKPLKLGAKETATGISVFKMAGHDRHGAWFARTSVHEGLGFAKWKRAMMREFPESLAVEGGPGVGNIRGIGGDRRLEDIVIDGAGKLEVYQLSAQFPGPTAPREFITLLLTSENCLSEASKVGNVVPRHYMVVSIPVTHPDAPPREGLVRGSYESVEMIREIPLGSSDDPETNPVEWIMITRSDPGGGIPRFMVERGTPGSIVADAGKFLDWACAKDDFPDREDDEQIAEESAKKSLEGQERSFSIQDSNGILAGVGTSIADRHRRPSRRSMDSPEVERPAGLVRAMTDTLGAYVPDSLNPLQRTDSHSSTSTSSSIDSFASAEQFNTAPDGLPIDDSIPTPSSSSDRSLALATTESQTVNGQLSRELQKIEQKRQQLHEKLEQARAKQGKETQNASQKTAKELERATEKHNKERKKHEDRYAKEVRKLEARRERETKKLLARQQKEADKNNLLKTQHERNEWRQKAELAEQENKLLKDQIGDLQRENTALVAKLGKTDVGAELLKRVREELATNKNRIRASSRASVASRNSKGSARTSDHNVSALHQEKSAES
ncbi:hypothetical protein BS50DRAFT_572993 [Corynespora cassiicola Philippines]|uniref:DUF3074 domain-containing protein n=1 Tax=Corynespora cassiicola Philippines TaxID=1448308 RepID=A0A2T2NRW3_CORCC|nr:hypothetical protein BS50DRAFT_572993 [Corynespora cassiicola Philippines]